MWAAWCTGRLLNMSRSSVCEKRRCVAKLQLLFKTQSGCCHAPSSVLAAAKQKKKKRSLKYHFQVFSPHICFPGSLWFALCKGTLGFLRHSRGELCSAPVSAEAACCTGRCDFDMRASKVSAFSCAQSKPHDQSAAP